ncbi:MAG: site-specific integrase [Treponema sp.]|nr:site-specific integrase [Treponema sp.]
MRTKIKEIAASMYSDGYTSRLEMMGRSMEAKTIKQKEMLLSIIVGEFGDRNLDDIKIKEVMSFLFYIDRSNSWKNRCLTVISEIYEEYNWSHKRQIPRPKFPRFINNSTKSDVFTEEELTVFFNSAYWTDKTCRLLFLLIAGCGLRLGEGRAVRKRQFQENSLIVDGFISSTGRRTNYNKGGKNVSDGKIRVVPVPDRILSEVTDYLSLSDYLDDDYVFIRHGKPLPQRYTESVFQRTLKKSGINVNGRKLVPHSLRYTYVTLLRRTSPVDDVRRLVGHTSASMTEYYTRPGLSDLLQNADNFKSTVDRIFG